MWSVKPEFVVSPYILLVTTHAIAQREHITEIGNWPGIYCKIKESTLTKPVKYTSQADIRPSSINKL